MRVYGGDDAIKRPTQANELIDALVKLPEDGNLLEIGAGKGQVLKGFCERHPRWRITALEPSISFESLTATISDADLHHVGLEEFAYTPASMDLVVALGVIEHVHDPLALLRRAVHMLRPGGTLFIEAPNFEVHPNDLFCADHLSKLTPLMLERLAEAAGFTVETRHMAGVPMYFVLRKLGAAAPLRSAYTHNVAVAQRNALSVRGMLSSIDAARRDARRADSAFGIFGLATVGLIAPFMLDFAPHEIAAYMDDNQETWGTELHGRRVGGPALIAERGIRHIALAMSPVYMASVAARLGALGAQVYAHSG